MNAATAKGTERLTLSAEGVSNLYTLLPAAVEELAERRRDAGLCSAVADFHSLVPPLFLPPLPYGALGRYVLTPSFEFDLFLKTAQAAGLQPLYLEYKRDVFLSRNPDKYRLLRPSFFIHAKRSRNIKLADFNGAEMKPLDTLKTKSGRPLAEFHHALFDRAYPDARCSVVDFSDWRKQTPEIEPNYLRFLALFICDGILFENYLANDESELRFVRERVVPAFEEVQRRFGVRPLIVRLLPSETESTDYWTQIPGALYSFALELKRNGS